MGRPPSQIVARPETFPVALLCPACLRRETGAQSVVLAQRPSQAGGDVVDYCSHCGTEFPRIEGIRCLPPDLEAFRAAQSFALDRDWLAAGEDDVEAVVRAASETEPDSTLFRETLLPAVYALAHFPETVADPLLQRELASNPTTIEILAGWLDRHTLPAIGGTSCALELGCGPGRMLQALAARVPGGAIGVDLRLSMLRVGGRLAQQGEAWLPFRTEGRRFEPVQIRTSPAPGGPLHFVQADVTALPFAPETFPLIVAMSLIDVVPDPLRMLRDLDSLLAPGGLLLLAAPYHWQRHTTPPKNWWSTPEGTGPSALRILLQGGHDGLRHLDYEILETAADLPWSLPGHRRFVYRYFLDGLLARKARRT